MQRNVVFICTIFRGSRVALFIVAISRVMCVFLLKQLYINSDQFDRHAKLHCDLLFCTRVTKSNFSRTEYDFRFGMLTSDDCDATGRQVTFIANGMWIITLISFDHH